MSRTSYHVIPVRGGGWSVIRAGATKASKIFDLKVDAVDFGKRLSANYNSILVVHRKDGTIQNADSFGNNSKDKK